MGKVIFEASSLSVSYNNKKIIDDINLSLEEGTLYSALSSNNSGKTTLIKTLSGIMYSDSGKIYVNGIELCKKNFNDFIINISTILEDINNSFICNKVEDELKYPLINLGYEEYEISDSFEEVLDIIKISSLLNKNISKLTYYEKVKVLLAASIIHHPKIVFIDNILRFLSIKEKKEMIKYFKLICSRLNICILFVTSDINDIIDLDNIYVFDSGKIITSGTYQDLIKNDNELSKLGFSIPTMIDLSRKLEFYDLIDDIYYDPDKVVDKLWN